VSQIEAEQKRQSQAQESTAAALTADVGVLETWRQSAAEAQDRLEQAVETVTTNVGAHTHDFPGQGIAQFKRGWATGLESAIVSGLPFLFSEFRGKQFSLLWRGGRDGFGARDFHRRCDGHANTLTLIEDRKGNIFGGFTPLEWDSSNCWKADLSLRSFIFTLKNPHNVPARRFALKAEKKDRAILCHPFRGPHFYDIGVRDDCNAKTRNFTSLGESYPNDTRLDGKKFFTGSGTFQVKEIEVFEITD
jgi:hypothetical protein